MGKRPTAIEKAIAQIDRQIEILTLAKVHLADQQDTKPKAAKKPRLVPGAAS